MVSSYLERPLRTLEQALEDRARARTSSGARSAPAADPRASGSGSVELLVYLLSDGARPAGGNADTAAAPEGSRPERRRAA